MIKKFFLIFLLLVACKKDRIKELSSLAEVGTANFSVTDATLINTPNSFKIFEGQGKKGIIVFNTGNPNIPFRAFDLGCPYISPSICTGRMTVDNSGTMTCESCVDDGISFTHFRTNTNVEENGKQKTYYLVEYSTSFDGNSIRITNFRR